MSEYQAFDSDIAIIGLSGRFPGAQNISALWSNLHEGRESISIFTDEELRLAGVDPDLACRPNYVRARGVLDQIDLFDAGFFAYNAREASILDPQHRIFLECAVEALEHAGHFTAAGAERIGVFAGSSLSTYLLNNLAGRSDITGLESWLGCDKDHLATSVAYKLDLRGPAINVQTACSTSLVAVHTACQSVLAGECDLALAGGVSVSVPDRTGYLYQRGGVFSPDGHCRAFDANAQGTVSGNGAGVVVLRRLSDAIADGDVIYAIIRGSAINNDGSAKVGYTAPSIEGQSAVIAEALAMARIPPESITCIEAHGTGTELGDPVEIKALTDAFRRFTAATNFCAIGSIKTNIGHLDAAAGVAGLIKMVMALHHRTLPASLHFRQPHPMIDFAGSPFYVSSETRPWPRNGTPRRAGASSFGMGGTNAHVVLEEAPECSESGPGRSAQLLLLSAKCAPALDAATEDLTQWFKDHPDGNLADAAFTLALGRRGYSHKRIAVASSCAEATTLLETRSPQNVLTAEREAGHRPIAFLFPGQGAQYVNMGRGLYQEEPVFRQEIDHCCETLRPVLGWDLRDALYPSTENEASASERLKNTHTAQPALFVVEYALARLWMSWGIKPDAMLGHSVGEYVAATLAGVFTVDDALRLVATRGRLMQTLPSGAMLAVPIVEDELRALLPPSIAIAAVNGPDLCVVSGPHEAIDHLETELSNRGLNTRRLHTSHAFHSAMMDPILEPYTSLVRTIPRNAPALPYISNVTGTWITAAEATAPEYWAQHLRGTVRFSTGLAEILQNKDYLVLEVGPGQTLTSLAMRQKQSSHSCVASIAGPQNQQADLPYLLGALGRMWLAGATVDWRAFYAGQSRHRVALPTYPFQRRRYWMEPKGAPHRPEAHSITKSSDPNRWLWVPGWKQCPQLAQPSMEPGAEWLVFARKTRFDDELIHRLRASGQSVIVVHQGGHFGYQDRRGYTLNPEELADYESLFRELKRTGRTPGRVLHLWTLEREPLVGFKSSHFERAQYRGLYSLIFLARAATEIGLSARLEVNLISTGLSDVTGHDSVCPHDSTALAACRVVPQELLNLRYRSLDIGAPSSDGSARAHLVEQVIAECSVTPEIPTVAIRGGRRWVPIFNRVTPSPARALLREGGVYIITGGLGKIGMVLATHLAERHHAKLILTSRTPFPPRENWHAWRASHSEDDAVSVAIGRIEAMEAKGARVLPAQADASDSRAMKRAFELAEREFGTIHGVIHAAGFTGEEALMPVTETGPGHCRLHYAPKISGVRVLESLLQSRRLDFCLLMSSLSTVLGGVGMCAYSGANQFLDAFAHSQTRNGRTRWISVNWDGWNFESPDESTAGTTADLALRPAEGVAAFEKALAVEGAPQVIVSTTDLERRADQWIARLGAEPDEDASNQMTSHDRPELASAYEAPRNDVERALAAMWQELLAVDRVGIGDNFFELGGNSLLALTLFSRIEKAFHRSLPISTLFDAPTIQQLASFLDDGEPAPSTMPPTVTPIQSTGNRPPLFCVHAVGGNVMNYRPLARRLGADQPVYGIQAMGLMEGEQQLQTIEEMAGRYVDDLLTFQPHGPYNLAGVSFGGLLAYEIACQIERRGETVGLVTLLDSAPSGAVQSASRVPFGQRVAVLGRRAGHHLRQLVHLDADAQFDYILRKSRTLKRRIRSSAWQVFYRWYAGIGQPLPDSLRDLTETNYLAAKDYVPKPSPLRLTLFRATRRSIESELGGDMGWGLLAKGGVEVHDMPGDHLSMLSEPNVRTVAATLRSCLDRAATESTVPFATLAAAGSSKVTARTFYNRINEQIDATPFADDSLFLNFGYAPDEPAKQNGHRHRINGNSIELVLRLVEQCDRISGDILDVGCGRGGTIMTLRQYRSPRRTVGMDLSSSAIKFCRRVHQFPATAFLEGDAEKLPFQRNSFDVVTNVESSHSYQSLQDFYGEVFRVLRPGGWFLCTDALPSVGMEHVRGLWAGIGFETVTDVDITANVLRSCDQTAESHRAAFRQRNELMDDFLAVPGSRVYCGMQNGDLTYRIMKLRKPPACADQKENRIPS